MLVLIAVTIRHYLPFSLPLRLLPSPSPFPSPFLFLPLLYHFLILSLSRDIKKEKWKGLGLNETCNVLTQRSPKSTNTLPREGSCEPSMPPFSSTYQIQRPMIIARGVVITILTPPQPIARGVVITILTPPQPTHAPAVRACAEAHATAW